MADKIVPSRCRLYKRVLYSIMYIKELIYINGRQNCSIKMYTIYKGNIWYNVYKRNYIYIYT